MIELENRLIPEVLGQILLLDRTTGQPVSGLLTERLSLKYKRRLNDFRDDLLKSWEKCQQDLLSINTEIEKIVEKRLPAGITIQACKESDPKSDLYLMYTTLSSEANKELSTTDKKDYRQEQVEGILGDKKKFQHDKIKCMEELDNCQSTYNYNFKLLNLFIE